MKILLGILIAIFFIYLALTLYVRFKPINYADYEYAPAQMPSDGEPHEYRRLGADAPEFNVDAKTLMQIANKVILQQPRTKLIKESPEGWALYEQKTLLMGYPDFISIQSLAVDGEPNKSQLDIVSVSRYGKSDFGVNKKRVQAWVQDIKNSIAQNP